MKYGEENISRVARPDSYLGPQGEDTEPYKNYGGDDRSRIQEHLDELNHMISRVDHQMVKLRDRLSPVLGPTPTNLEQMDATEMLSKDAASPIRSQLSMAIARLEDIARLVVSVEETLEI